MDVNEWTFLHIDLSDVDDLTQCLLYLITINFMIDNGKYFTNISPLL